jgi:hypothetical protein
VGRVMLQRMDNVGIVVESLDAEFLSSPSWASSSKGEPRSKETGQSASPDCTTCASRSPVRLCYVRGPEGILIGLAEQSASGLDSRRESPSGVRTLAQARVLSVLNAELTRRRSGPGERSERSRPLPRAGLSWDSAGQFVFSPSEGAARRKLPVVRSFTEEARWQGSTEVGTPRARPTRFGASAAY